MTVTNASNVKTYTGNAVTTAFSTTFQFFDAGDIKVYLDGVLKTITTHYTVTGGNGSTGTITFLSAPGNGVVIVLQRLVEYKQGTDYADFDGNPAVVTEKQFDLVVMQTQQLADSTARSLLLPVGSNSISSSLPTPSAGKALIWNHTADAIINSTADVDASVAAAAFATAAAASAVAAAASAAAAAADASLLNGFNTLYTYGAVGDGVTDDTAAFTAAESAGKTIMITDGTFRLNANKTLTINLVFLGGKISVDSGKTLTINGSIDASAKQIFTGSGTVVGSSNVALFIFPEWWGAVGNGRVISPTDDTAAVQAAINFSTYHSVCFLKMYAVTGVSRVTPGITIYGFGGGMGVKANDNMSGLSAYSSTQDYVLRMGDGTANSIEIHHVILQGFTLDGRENIINYGLLYTQNFSQCKVTDVSMRHAHGAGLYTNKGEDVNYLNCQFTCLGYRTLSADCTGGIVFATPPSQSAVGNNAIRFDNCRFEWIDGGFIRSNSTNIYALQQVMFVNCKFEQSTSGDIPSGIYGSHGLDWPYFHIVNDSSNIYYVEDLTIHNCAFNGTQNVSMLFKFGNFVTIRITDNYFGGGYGSTSTLKLFEIEKSDGSQAISEGFIFRGNTFRDFDENNAFAVTTNYHCSNPCIFEPLYHYKSYASTLSNRKFMDILEANEFAGRGFLALDPDSADPCLGALGCVAKVSGQTFDRIAILGNKTTYTRMKGIQNKNQGFLRIRARVKKAGSTATAVLQVVSDNSNFFGNITVPSYYWEHVDFYLNQHEVWPAETGLALQNTNTNNSAHSIYMDTVELTYTDYIFAAATPSSDTWDIGNKVYYTAPASLGTIGAVCTTSGTFGTLSGVTANTTNGSNIITVSSTTNLRVGMYITTAAGGLTAAKIININGSTITVNANASSSQTGTAVSYAAPVFKTFGTIS